MLRGGPAGGGYSTVEDLLAFDRALRTGKLVSQAMLDQLWTAHPELASPEYGYGFGIRGVSSSSARATEPCTIIPGL